MVDTPNGKVRVRRWPRKRGKPKSQKQRDQNEWFRQASWAMKYMPPEFHAQAEILTAGTPLLPRDVLMMAMAGRLYGVVLPGGQRLYPMSFVTDVSESLDALGLAPGSVLARGQDRWHALVPNQSGLVLTSVENALPEWLPPSGGGGATLKTGVTLTSNLGGYTSGQYIQWQTEEIDEGGLWLPDDPTRFTVPAPGLIRVETCVFFSNLDGSASCYVRIDAEDGEPLGGGAFDESWIGSGVVPWMRVQAGDTFRVRIIPFGGTRTLLARSCRFGADYIPDSP